MRTTSHKRKPAPQDWHPADIIAELWKRRLTLRRLSARHGYEADSLRHALRRPWPAAERVIASAIQRPPQAIWPSRYNDDGTPRRGRASRPTIAAA